MTDRNLMIVKIVSTALVGIALIIAGIEFYNHRNFREPVVIGPGVTNVKTLGDYFAPLKGTINDTNIYIIDSGVPGGTALVIGRSHPEEPATNLAAKILVENAMPSKGRLIVAITANQSGSRVTRPGDAYPMYYTIETPWGESKYRMGDRWTSPLD
ncbi:MAG: succinylglutamate desuccinylase, partial [Mesotoga sp.]|nr:succinylglutamate desuccinylase [Mesotoga sp.]